MTITKLKSVGSWRTVRWLDGDTSESRRLESERHGRVLTGLLTREPAHDDDPAATEPSKRDR